MFMERILIQNGCVGSQCYLTVISCHFLLAHFFYIPIVHSVNAHVWGTLVAGSDTVVVSYNDDPLFLIKVMYFTILSLDGVPSGPIYYLATLTFNLMRVEVRNAAAWTSWPRSSYTEERENVYVSDCTFFERSEVYNVTIAVTFYFCRLWLGAKLKVWTSQ